VSSHEQRSQWKDVTNLAADTATGTLDAPPAPRSGRSGLAFKTVLGLGIAATLLWTMLLATWAFRSIAWAVSQLF
jgi:hypothetical protein